MGGEELFLAAAGEVGCLGGRVVCVSFGEEGVELFGEGV